MRLFGRQLLCGVTELHPGNRRGTVVILPPPLDFAPHPARLEVVMSFRLAVFAVVLIAAPLVAAEPVDYVRDIKPIFKERCYACHGALKQKASCGSTRSNSHQGRQERPGRRARQPRGSLLLDACRDPDDDTRMPPEGKPLTARTDRPLKAWIEQGRRARGREAGSRPAKHWAFQPGPAAAPVAADPARNAIPIDAFLAAEWAKRGLQPVRRSRQGDAPAPRLPRPDRPAADARRAARLPQGRRRPTPTRRWSIGCSRPRSTASAGAGTGWTSGATPTGTAGGPCRTCSTATARSGGGATGSSARSTTTAATTGWSA